MRETPPEKRSGTLEGSLVSFSALSIGEKTFFRKW
jgi:hypothetical protein